MKGELSRRLVHSTALNRTASPYARHGFAWFANEARQKFRGELFLALPNQFGNLSASIHSWFSMQRTVRLFLFAVGRERLAQSPLIRCGR